MSPEPVRSNHPTAGSRIRRLLSHPISMAGLALSLVSLANIFLFVLVDFIAQRPSPYVGILAYIVSPGFLICGLLLIVIGAWRARRDQHAESPTQAAYPRIDF